MQKEKRVLLTGASSGIGRVTAELLLARGYEIWGTARDISKLPQKDHFHPIAMELTNPQSIDAGFDQAERESGGIDILINNAGNGCFGPIEAFSPAELETQFAILVHAPLHLIRRVLPAMRARNAGTIVNVTSLSVRFPIPFMSAYSAAKAALASFTHALQIELSATRIRVVELQPGDIRTNFQNAMRQITSPINQAYEPARSLVWDKTSHDVEHGPEPEVVACKILEILLAASPLPVAKAGDFFQTRLATLGNRLLPTRLMRWVIRKYYGL